MFTAIIQKRAAAYAPLRAYITLFFFLLLALSPAAWSATYTPGSGPYTDKTGSYTVSWSWSTNGTGSSVTLSEQANGGSWVALASGSTSVSKAVSRGNGIYGYKVRYCTHYAGPYGPILSCNESSTTVTVAKAPAVPAVSATAPDCSTLTVSWSPGSGYPSGASKRYDIDESVNGGGYSRILTNTPGTTTTRSNLTENTDYGYRVRAYYVYNGATSGISGWVYKDIGTLYCPAGTPTIPAAPPVSTTGSYAVDWVSAASGDNTLYERLNGGPWTAIDSVTGSGISRSAGRNLGNGVYDYYAKACAPDNVCQSSAAATTTVVRTPGLPGTISYSPSALDNCAQDYTVAWGSAAAGNRYELAESADNGNTWTVLGTNLTGASFTRVEALPDRHYEYRVRARYYLNGHYSDWSGWQYAGSDIHVPSCPSSGDAPTAPTVDYDGAYTVSGYGQLYERSNGGGWVSVGGSPGVSVVTYTVSPAKATGVYEYKSYITPPTTYTSPFWSSVSTTHVLRTPASPGVTAVLPSAQANRCNTVEVAWPPGGGYPEGADRRFDVEGSLDGGAYLRLETDTTLTGIIQTPLQENKIYSYRVRSRYNWNGFTSEYTPWQTAAVTTEYCKPGKVALPSRVLAANGDITVSWSAPAGGAITGYLLEKRHESAPVDQGNWTGWTRLDMGTALSHTDTGGPKLENHDYQYRVAAVNAHYSEPAESDWSNIANQRIPYPAPGAPTWQPHSGVDASLGWVTLNWNSPAQGTVTGYKLYQRPAGASAWSEIYGGDQTSREVTGLVNGQDYEFEVRACNPDNLDPCGAASAVYPFQMPGLPPNVPVTPGGVNAPRLSETGDYLMVWGASAEGGGHVAAEWYELRQTSERDGSTAVSGYNIHADDPACYVFNGSAGSVYRVNAGATALACHLFDQPNDLYHYEIRACHGTAGCSAFSVEDALASVIVVRPPAPPAAPGDPGNGFVDPGPAVDAGDYHGVLRGQLTASPNGAASYALPIAIPPGTAGVAPKLSLNFNSQAGNGIAGLGWSIGGLSQMSRCNQTVSQDGNNHAANHSAQDRFCLDGQRLMLVAGTYGAAGSEYRTELNGFGRIFITGGSTGHPGSFRVETKSGEVLYYGTTADSQFDAAGAQPTISQWALSRVEDTFGNYFTAHYDESADGSFSVDRIEYTGHTGGAQPYHTVQFNYESRPDTGFAYSAGYAVHQTRRLSGITTPLGTYTLSYANGSGAASASRLTGIEYCSNSNQCLAPLNFEWDVSASSAGWRVVPGYEPPAMLVDTDSDIQTNPGTMLIDLNGDGLPDLVEAKGFSPDNYKSWLNTGSGWQLRPEYKLPYALTEGNGNARAMLLEVDGDGRPDMLVDAHTEVAYEGCYPNQYYDCDQQYFPNQVFLNRVAEGQGWVLAGYSFPATQVTATNVFVGNGGVRYGDVNGDGRVDILQADLYYTSPQSSSETATIRRAWLNTGNGWALAMNYAPLGNFVDKGLIKQLDLLDVNQDGFVDLVGGSGTSAYLNTGHGWSPTLASVFPAQVRISGANAYQPGSVLVDLNGDNRLDVVQSEDPADSQYCTPVTVNCNSYPNTPEVRQAWFNTGAGWSQEHAAPYLVGLPLIADADYSFADLGVRFADINSDGRGDMLKYPDAWLNTPEGWMPAPAALRPPVDFYSSETYRGPNGRGVYNDGSGAQLVDVNGDGVLDIVQSKGTSRGVWVNDYQPPRLTGITDGHGLTTTVHYASITDPEAPAIIGHTVYEPEAGSTEHVSLAMPVTVVAKIDSPDGLGGTLTSRYQYRGLKAVRTGRGIQGFREIITTDAQGFETRIEYAQTFPYTGMPVKVEQRHNAVLLKRTETDYCYMTEADTTSVADPLPCPAYDDAAHNDALFVHPRTTIETAYRAGNYSGTSFAVTGAYTEITTHNLFDRYGNPTRVDVRTEGSNGEVFRTLTENQYSPNGDERLQRLGRLTRAKVTVTHADQAVTQRTTAFEYDPVHTLLTREIVEPDAADPNLKLTTAYARDQYGNITAATACAGSIGACVAGAASSSDGRIRTTKTSYRASDFQPPSLHAGMIQSVSYGDGRFPVRTENALGHREYTAYDPLTGNLVQQTGPNGVHSCWSHNSLGRLTAETARCGTAGALTTTTDSRTVAGNSLGAVTAVIVTPATGANTASRVYYDVFGREVRSLARGFEGQYILKDAVYDRHGRAISVTEPYFSGETVYTTQTDPDPLGRAMVVHQQLGDIDGTGARTATLTHSYEGYSTTTTRTVWGQTRTRTETHNSIGQTVSITDALQNPIEYRFDPSGNLTDTYDPNNNRIHLDYDARGRKIAMDDPDMGEWTYVYNSFGELIKQTDAKSQITLLQYDALGRLVARADNASIGDPYADLSAEAQLSTWIYDTALGAGIGKLHTEASPADSRATAGACGGKALREYHYSAFGQTAASRDCIDGQWFDTGRSYDGFGRLQLLTYPEVNGTRLRLQYHYSQYGYLHYMTDPDDEGSVYWIADALNAKGQLTEERARNGIDTQQDYNPATGALRASLSIANADPDDGVVQHTTYHYDEAGNLRERARWDDYIFTAANETFDYDALDRITTAEVNNPDPDRYDDTEAPYYSFKSYDYDALGNIIDKSDVGTYTYNSCTAGTRSAGPHALCAVDGSQTFQYDANGNLTWGTGRSIQYSAFNKPTWIQHTGNNATAEFVYGADRSRVLRITHDDARDERIVYVGLGATGGTLYERKLITEPGVQQGVTEHMHFIYAGGYHNGQAFAVNVIVDDPTTANSGQWTEYFHRDHLGSVIALTDDSGILYNLANQSHGTLYSYDAFGKRRNPNWTEGPYTAFDIGDPEPVTDPDGQDQYTTVRGHLTYTGHEAITEIGLIHMNGRVYDPELGKFLSADPHVQFVADLQSYNRYSYVHNNPLKHTDPSGYFLKNLLQATLGRLPPEIITVASVVLSFTPFAWVVPYLNAAYAYANGASIGETAFAFALSYVAQQVGGDVAGAAGLTGNTAVIVAGAVAGGITGGINAASGGQSLGKGMLIGATTGAMMAAIHVGRGSDPDVSQGSNVEADQGREQGNNPEFADGSITPGFNPLTPEELAAQQRAALARAANADVGNTDYALNVAKSPFEAGDYKCNLYVYDKLGEVSIPAPTNSGGSWPLQAGNWANPNHDIRGWSIVDTPQAGDVVAWANQTANATGHVGIVVDASAELTVSAGRSSIVRNQFGFDNPNRNYVFRRYVGN